MKISVKETTLVKPMEEAASGGAMWLSSLDLVMPATYHTRSVYFFRPDGSGNFFDAAVLKAALSRVLVQFYPYAGRLRRDDNGRVEINCSGEGVMFIEAECDGALDDLVPFSTRPADLTLVPVVDYSGGISSFPLSLLQLTRFKCGGVSLGVASEHHVADGIAALHYINTWSAIARGTTAAAFDPPFMDRRLLAPRDPPQPKFPHVEHQFPPSLNAPLDISDTLFKTFAISGDQIKSLKRQCTAAADSIGRQRSYTSYETVAGHVWRCVCLARGLPEDQETKLQLPVDSRPRMRPPLPPRYFGNAIFYTTSTAKCGEMVSNPVEFAVEKVHEAVARMDDEYLRSALDYVELQLPQNDKIVRSGNNVKCPNFGITSWVRLPFYEADFGWGKPVYAGPGGAVFEGKSFLFADPDCEGGFLLAITLLKPHMEIFHKFLYDI